MIHWFNWLLEPGLSGFLDILFAAFILYTLLVWSQKTRSASVLMGILIVAGVYLVTRQLNMVLATGLLEQFFKIILIALVIIFQEELRYFFEQIALWSTGRGFGKKQAPVLSREEVDVLVRTLKDLARDKIGALIVIRGKDLVIRHLDGGTEIDAKMSEALLKSLFDPHSIGHDGAIFIKGGRLVKFSCHLPLSKNLKKVGQGGTRHTAALGLSELCDALCLVVSEERGTISVARRGELQVVSDPERLSAVIGEFYDEVHPRIKANPTHDFLFKNYREKAVGLLLAILIWFILVYGTRQTYKTYLVPADYEPLEPGYVVESIEPRKAYVTLGGPRHSFYFLDSNKISLLCKLDTVTGVQEVNVNPLNLQIPPGLEAEVLLPNVFKFKVRKVADSEGVKVNIQHKGSNIVTQNTPRLEAVPGGGRGQQEAAANPSQPSALPVPPVLEVKSVKQLEDAKPEDVVKYLEKKEAPTTAAQSS